MKKFLKEWWPLLLIAGWWIWKMQGKKKQISAKISTRDDAIQYLKEKFSGISGAVGWSQRDLDPNGGPYPMDGIDFIPGLTIGGENVTADDGGNLMAAFRVLFGDAPTKAIYTPPFMMTPFGMSQPSFKVIFTSDKSATEARNFLTNLFQTT